MVAEIEIAPDELGPQPGPQTQALASPADIVIFGGSAGGGKSESLILETLRHIDNPLFRAVIFRRTSPQLEGAGSLWERANTIYPAVAPGVRLTQNPLRAVFPSGASAHFLHLQHEHTKKDHQGKQYTLVCFDELTHFLESQFWYLLSRMRSMSGIQSYMRATTNPDPDHFVRRLIDWWIGPDGYAIRERSGKLRYFVRRDDVMHWADSPGDLAEHCDPSDPEDRPLSLTFIRSDLADNPALMQIDPGYRARLKAMANVDRERLELGNWNIRPRAGDYIKAEWFVRRWEREEDLPPLHVYIGSDYAVTERASDNDPDYTEHAIVGVDANDDIYVLDWWHGQTESDVWVDRLLDKVARWKPLEIYGEKGVIANAVRPILERRMRERKIYVSAEWIGTQTLGKPGEGHEGYDSASKRAKSAKARSFQARAKLGKIILPARADWVDRVISQWDGFPTARYDDAFDAISIFCQAIDRAEGKRPPPKREQRRRDRYAIKPESEESWRTA